MHQFVSLVEQYAPRLSMHRLETNTLTMMNSNPQTCDHVCDHAHFANLLCPRIFFPYLKKI